ncbi:hypothetical protein OAD67_03715 [bacterium]|nr:hypothetical protein [bacterium]
MTSGSVTAAFVVTTLFRLEGRAALANAETPLPATGERRAMQVVDGRFRVRFLQGGHRRVC